MTENFREKLDVAIFFSQYILGIGLGVSIMIGCSGPVNKSPVNGTTKTVNGTLVDTPTNTVDLSGVKEGTCFRYKDVELILARVSHVETPLITPMVKYTTIDGVTMEVIEKERPLTDFLFLYKKQEGCSEYENQLQLTVLVKLRNQVYELEEKVDHLEEKLAKEVKRKKCGK